MKRETNRRVAGRTNSAKRALYLMLAVVPMATAFSSHLATAANFTWDPSGNTVGSDASGNWDTTDLFWAPGGGPDVVWPNAATTSVAIFGSGGSGPQTVTLTTAINANGLTFNAGPTYTIASAAPADILTLNGTTPTITVASGATPTISAPIAGTAGLTYVGADATAITTLTGANTYTGGTIISGGALTVNAGGTLGAATGALTLGTTAGASPIGVTLNLNTNTTVGSLVSNVGGTGVTNTVNIATGDTLTVNGAATFGALGVPELNTFTGGGNLTVTTTTSSFAVGVTTPTTAATTTLDISGLSNFTFTATTGNFAIGTGVARVTGVMTLASVSNTITGNNTFVGGLSTSNSGLGTLNLGTGTNTINTNTLSIGQVKSAGTVQFLPANTTGTVLIDGITGGNSTATIIVGSESSATSSSTTSNLSLANHNAIVHASSVTIGASVGNTGGTPTGAVTFDTGTFTTGNLSIGVASSGTSALGAKGTFTLGTTSANTGVLNVTGNFALAANTNTAAAADVGTFTINGGTANIGSNINVPIGTHTTVAATATVNLLGGTLNMGNGVAATNFQIGAAGSFIGATVAVNMPTAGNTATIQNLGGGGIFANSGTGTTGTAGGLTMGDAGTLLLAGNNTFTGPTTLTSGTVQFASATPAVNSTVTMNGGALAFSPSIGTFQIGGLAGSTGATLSDTGSNPVTLKIGNVGGNYSGALTGNGGLAINSTAGTQILSGINTYSGNTSVNAGNLSVEGQLYSGVVSPGTVLVDGGTLSGSGQISSSVNMTSGKIAPDLSGVPLHLGALSMGGGSLLFTLTGNVMSNITVDGLASLTSGTLSFADSTPAAGTYTLISAGSLANSLSLASQVVNGTTFTPFVSGGLLEVTVSGAPSNLVWVGANASGTWDVATTKNFNNITTSTNPDLFHNFDTVTFDDTSTHPTVNITATVQPASVTFNNNTNNYVINSSNGTGIGGNATVTLTGAGNVTLNTANSYTGDTDVNGTGSLIIGSGGVVASGNVNVNTGTLAINSGGSITGANATVASGGTMTVAAGGLIPTTLNLIDNGAATVGSSHTIATLNGNTTAATLNVTGTLTVSGGGNYAGSISNGSGAGSLSVTSGTLILASLNPSTYSGGTTISGGTLQVGTSTDANDIPSALGTGPVIDNAVLSSASGRNVTLANAISGNGSVQANGTGQLTLSGSNSYSGGTMINSGLVQVNTGSSLGAATGALVLGTPEPVAGGVTNSPTGALTLNNSITVGSFSSTSGNATANTLTINQGFTMTDTGAFNFGFLNTTAITTAINSNLTVNGGGSLVVTGITDFNIGQASNNLGGKDVNKADMSGLNSVSVNTTGNFNIGFGANNQGNLLLADANVNSVAPVNFVNATIINVGNTNTGNDAGTSTLTLGSGTNTLQANNINLGFGKTGGIVTWAADAGATSSVTIAGTGGSGVANIVLGNANGGTYGTARLSQLLLAGHVATVQAGALVIGENTGNSGGGANGTVTFDTGTFNAQGVTIGVDTGGTSTTGPQGTLTIGTDSNSTGVFTVNGNGFILGGNTNAAVAATATATFTINGGTVTIGSNITVPSTTGTTTSTFTFASGTLNMVGNAIGGNGTINSGNGPITTVNLATGGTAVLENLGGTGINGAGINLNSGGTLVLDGSNTYTGGTAIVSGTLQVGQATSTPLGSPLGASSGTVTNNTTLNFASNNSITVANSITGNGQLNQNGNGTTTLSSATSSFVGPIAVNAGTLVINGVLNNSSETGTIAVNGGTLGGSGATNADVTLSSGTLRPFTAGMSVNSLTTNGGTLQFNVNGATIGHITSLNAATLNGGQLSFGLIAAPTLGSYTILTSSALSNSLALTPFVAGRTTFTPSVSGNSLVVAVSGGPASLTWNNSAGGDGTTWDVVGQKNWASTAATDPNHFYQFDNVTFNDSNNGKYAVNVSTTVTPLSVTVTTNNTYTFSGTGSIAGFTGLTMSGSGTLSLANTGGNTYSGATTITSGTLQVATAGALPAGTSLSIGTGALDLDGNSVTIGALSGNGTITNSSGSAIGTLNLAGLGANTYGGSINNGGSKQTSLHLASGSLILTGTNGYTGATNINSGASLQVGNGTTGSLSGSTAITDNGTLTIDLTNPTIANNISGVGQLVENVTGTMILTGTNSYGATNILSGTLQVGNGGSGGSLGQGSVTNNSAVVFDVSSNLTVDSVISGNGTVQQTGSGTVSLTGKSTYTGATTINAATTLAVLTGGALPSASVVTDNGTLNLSNGGQSISSLNGPSTAAVNLNATLLTLTGTGVYSGTIADAGTLGSVLVTGNTTTGGIQVNALNVGQTTGNLTASGNLKIAKNGAATGTTKVNALTLTGTTSAWTSSLDITNNKLIVEDSTATHATTLATVQNEVSFGTTNAAGILSSTTASNKVTLVFDNATLGLTSFGGTNNVDAGSVLVFNTFKGDANLDGVVNISDLNVVAANWQKSVSNWTQGDFNGDGIVNISDLNVVAANWQDGAGSGSSFSEGLASIPALGTVATPEPASLALLGLGSLLLTKRRRN